MKQFIKYSVLIVVAPGILTGCAAMPAGPKPKTATPALRENSFATQMTHSPSYLNKASVYETEGDLQKALYYLNIAAHVSPQDKQISKKLVDLKKRIDTQAKVHFKAGLKHYRNQQLEKARQAFLNTLGYNPQHPEALVYLKTRLSPFKFVTYTAKKGEKKTDIAKKIFQDPDKAFLISYLFEETGDQKFLKQGIRMELPYLETAPPAKRKPKPAQPTTDAARTYQLEESSPAVFNIESELAKADGFLKNKQYDDALLIADTIFEHDNFSKEAEGLINRVYFQKGHDLFQAKHYVEARTYLSFIDPDFISTEEIQAKIKTILDKKAEAHYLKGVNYFINEDLENAIGAWETVLKLNPAHEKAQTDIDNAKHLLEKLQNLE